MQLRSSGSNRRRTNMIEKMTAKARRLLAEEGVIVAPSAYDAMSAKLIEKNT